MSPNDADSTPPACAVTERPVSGVHVRGQPLVQAREQQESAGSSAHALASGGNAAKSGCLHPSSKRHARDTQEDPRIFQESLREVKCKDMCPGS